MFVLSQLRPSMAVLYHENGKLQRAYFDILKFILGLEAWGNKTKEMYLNNDPIAIVQVWFPLRDSRVPEMHEGR